MGKLKGLALIPAIKALRHLRPVAGEKISEDLQTYLGQEIFPSQWYDEDDLMRLLNVLVSLLEPRPDIWEWLGSEGAGTDFTTVYSAFIQKGQPAVTLQRYPRIWGLYHDNGAAQVDVSGRTAHVMIVGHMVKDLKFCRLQSGHFQRILELAGAASVNVLLLNSCDENQPAQWNISW